ncbi:hypothetical protein NQ317_002314, partial [Molorchus minor]
RHSSSVGQSRAEPHILVILRAGYLRPTNKIKTPSCKSQGLSKKSHGHMYKQRKFTASSKQPRPQQVAVYLSLSAQPLGIGVVPSTKILQAPINGGSSASFENCGYWNRRIARHEERRRFEEFIESHLDIAHKNELLVRKEAYKEIYESFIEVQDKIEESDETKVAERIPVKNKYFATLAQIASVVTNDSRATTPQIDNNTVVSNHNVTSTVNPNSSRSDTQFLRQVEEWNSFLDLFYFLIHNNQNLSEKNYTAAWDILKKRFNNEFVIIDTHISALLNVPAMAKGNPHNLREFLTNGQATFGFACTKISNRSYAFLRKKLDYQTHKAYELERSKTELAHGNGIFGFLKRYCVVLETVSSAAPSSQTSNTSKKQRVSLHNTTSTQSDVKKCRFCTDNGHVVYQCTKFKDLSFDKKREFVNKNGLCYNCLKKGPYLVSM